MFKQLCFMLIICSNVAFWFGSPSSGKAETAAAPDVGASSQLDQATHFGSESHMKDGEHNPNYDHEEFLGPDQAREFDELSPDESRRRLGLIYDKIDKDNDGLVTRDELSAWIKHIRATYVRRTTDEQWQRHHHADGKLTWDTYNTWVYGFLNDTAAKHSDADRAKYLAFQARDRRRFDAADRGKKGYLTKDDFAYFLHPEEGDHTKPVTVRETTDDMDKDKDGFISFDEYVGAYERADGDHEPEWVEHERKYFMEFRDKDKDGKLNFEEIMNWIHPADYDHGLNEARHLIYHADEDKDEKLSKAEVLNKMDHFVGSQATDYGNALKRHVEL